MDTVLKSRNAALLSNPAAIHSYTVYRDRVLADGGQIVDPTACQAAFTFLTGRGLSPVQFVVGAKFGVRMNAGRVDKLYSFDGNDMVATGGIDNDGPFYDAAKPSIRVDGISTGAQYFVSQYALPLQTATANGFCMALCGRTNSGDNRTHNFQGFHDGGLYSPPLALTLYNNDQGVTEARFAVAKSGYVMDAANAAYIDESVAGAYGDYKGVVGFCNTANGTVSTYSDGTLVVNAHAVATGLHNYKTAALKLILGSSYYNGGVINYWANNTTEAWIIHGCASADALALSQRLADLY